MATWLVVGAAVLATIWSEPLTRTANSKDAGRLLEMPGRVPEPRQRRGIRHGLAGVLAVAAAAVLAKVIPSGQARTSVGSCDP
jgi:hypothetical protein